MSQRLTSFFLYIITLVTLQFTAMFDGCDRVASDVGENADRIIMDTNYTDSYEKLCMDFHEDGLREKFDNEDNEMAAKEIPKSLKTRWRHVWSVEFILKIVQMVTYQVCL